MASIEVIATESIDTSKPETSFKLVVDVTMAAQIPRELFVYTTSNEPSHVATQDDILRYPVGEAAALAQNLGFYRTAHYERSFGTASLAAYVASHVQQRLERVVREVGASNDAPFGGVTRRFEYDSQVSA